MQKIDERLERLVHGAVLALIIGWVLYIGKAVFVPIVLSILVVYVIIGVARLLEKIPLLDRALPQIRDTLSVLIITLGLVVGAYLIIGYRDSLAALAPRYQESLLAAIQQIAVFFRIETEPTWTSLRQDLLAQINVASLIGSMVAAVSSLAGSILVVALYAGFLLVERTSFAAKVASLSTDPGRGARILEITADINAQIGSYLALKTLLGILLGALSWAFMALVGLELAGFWAALITLLNYVPYFGSFASVLFPGVMAIVQFGDSSQVLAVLLPLIVIQFLIGNFLDPYVMAKSLNLSPFVILVSLTVWAGLWGIPGAFVAVPITSIMAIVFSEFAATRPIAVLLSKSGQLRSIPR